MPENVHPKDTKASVLNTSSFTHTKPLSRSGGGDLLHVDEHESVENRDNPHTKVSPVSPEVKWPQTQFGQRQLANQTLSELSPHDDDETPFPSFGSAASLASTDSIASEHRTQVDSPDDLNSAPLCSRVPVPLATPAPSQAMSLPRLGCGGPSQYGEQEKASYGTMIPVEMSSVSPSVVMPSGHQEPTEQPQDSLINLYQPEDIEKSMSHPMHTESREKGDHGPIGSADHQNWAETPPLIPPTHFQAMPLPRLGCGGPSHKGERNEHAAPEKHVLDATRLHAQTSGE
eukprot:s3651_g5.t1